MEEYSKLISEKDEKAIEKYFKITGEIQMETKEEELAKMTKNEKYTGRMENGWLRIQILGIRLGKEANYDNKI